MDSDPRLSNSKILPNRHEFSRDINAYKVAAQKIIKIDAYT